MKASAKFMAALVVSGAVAVPANAQMRRNIGIVGSSTVYPFSKAIPGIRAYYVEAVHEGTFGPQGYLMKLGLIALPEAVRTRHQGLATTLTPMSGAGLK